MNAGMVKLIGVLICTTLVADLPVVSAINSQIDERFDRPLAGSPKTIWVDDDFVDDPPNHKWDTIQEGVDDADVGDTVFVFNGTYLENVVVNKTIDLAGEDRNSTVVDGGSSGDVISINADWVNVTGFRVLGNASVPIYSGIYLYYAANSCRVAGNDISLASRHGIHLNRSNHNIITGNFIMNDDYGIRLSRSNHNIITGNIIMNDNHGISLTYTFNNIIASNVLWTIGYGIILTFSYNNAVLRNMFNSSSEGIWVTFADNMTISHNFMDNIESDGIMLSWVTNSQISNNIIHSRSKGITHKWSHYNTVFGNAITSDDLGIAVSNSDSNTLLNNTISGALHGITLGHSENNTISESTVSSKYVGINAGHSFNTTVTHSTISSGSSGVELFWCDYSTVSYNTISGENWGVKALISENIAISHNTFGSSKTEGIRLQRSDNSIISSNVISNSEKGICIYASDDNLISDNKISSNNEDGVCLISSNNNEFVRNTVSSNDNYGFYVKQSVDGAPNGNLFYHNNIMNNRRQVSDNIPQENDWHHPVLEEGNCWSDYTGVDDGSGTGKHAIAGDGIGDTMIPHPNPDYDYYPIVRPGCWMAPPNNPPVADAGLDQTVYVGDVVQFDGSGSYDPDGELKITTVDSIGQVGEYTSLALDKSNNPHISYHDRTNGYLKYAKWTGSMWEIDVVDENGTKGHGTSLVLDSNGFPHISYMDISKNNLKYAEWDGTAWNIETVDGTGTVGWFPSIALDSNEYPHIAYKDGRNDDLRYAKWNGSAWIIEIADSLGNVGGAPSLVLDGNDNAHISYLDASFFGGANLKYAKWTGTTWYIKTVDWSGNVGRHSSLVLDKNDYPRISYQDAKADWTDGDLKYTWWNGSAWNIEVVDSSGDVGFYTSQALDENGYQHITYYDRESGDLKYAKWTGSSWYIETLDSIGDVGLYTSLSIDSMGISHVSYYDASNGDLKYLRKIGGIVSYDWDFGDGSLHGSGMRPTHVYINAGVYNVALTVTDAQGAEDTDDCIVTVLQRNQPPVADAGPDQTVYVGDVVQFDGSGSYDPDAGWRIETVDSGPILTMGWYTSIALNGAGNPHISYHFYDTLDLRFAKLDGGIWSIETVDSEGDVGRHNSMDIDSNGYPHIGYYDMTNRDLKYANWTGTTWSIESVDIAGDVGMFASLALDSADRPHMSYCDITNNGLKYAKWNGISWDIETVDTSNQPGWIGTSIALDDTDVPHIAYHEDYPVFDLKYAVWNGTVWNIETIDSEGGVGVSPSIDVDSNGYPHISYFDLDNYGIKYAHWNGTGWNIEIVYSAADESVVWHSSLAVDNNDDPHIGFVPYPTNDIKYAKLTGDTWKIESVGYSVKGQSLSMTLDGEDKPHMSYVDGGNEELKYARIASGIVSYDWDFDDGSPHGTGVRPTHVYASPGIYNVTLTVADTEGATDTDNCIITVLSRNQPPVADANGPYYVDEGSPITLNGSGSYDPDGDTLQYRWDLDNDGSWDTDWLSSPFFNHTWGDDYQGQIALQVMSFGDEKEDINAEGNYLWFGAVNYFEERGQSFVPQQSMLTGITVDVRVSYGTPNADLFLYVRESIDGPNLTYTSIPPEDLPTYPYPPPEDWPIFDFPDIEVEIGKVYYFVLTSPLTEGNYEIHISNDTYADGNAYYHVYMGSWETDPERDLRFRTYTSETILSEPGYTTVTVSNVAPTVELKAQPIETDVSLRIAGEKWHDVSVELYEDDILIAQGNLTRYPGSPNDQMLDLAYLEVNISRGYSAIVRYTPEDDPINGQPNGANPCWIVLSFDDGEEVRLHHNFNVQHPDRYVWEVDLTAAILSHGITFVATAFDPGADDLTFTWDFGDGTIITNFYPNVNKTFPVQITERITHAFIGSGTFTIILTVEDDDYGAASAVISISIG